MNRDISLNVSDGLATLGPEAVEIRRMLERLFLSWAAECKAETMLFPPLLRVRDLDGLDYFRNFPHLALMTAGIRPELLEEKYVGGAPVEVIQNTDLTPSNYALPSAACYSIYLHLRNASLDEPKYVTTVASCFRNEKEYEGLKRLWAFTMREIVCIGPANAVKEHLRSFKERLLGFSNLIDMPLEVEAASDPFYQSQSSRAIMQQVFPVKEEFVYGGSVAIASVNFHRNFFGERCNISTGDKEMAYSGCVAFGIERWLHALFDRFQGDVERIKEKLAV